jgi:cellobiose phosphorylase
MAAREMARLAKRMGRKEDSATYAATSGIMEIAIQRKGWDGNWYLQGYDADGNKIGSRQNYEDHIFLEPQGICTMAGLGLDDGRAERALISVREELFSGHGLLSYQPGQTSSDPSPDEIGLFSPGKHKKPGIFGQTNAWIVIAETMLGHGDAGFEYYQIINPSYRETNPGIYLCEPYAYPRIIPGQNVPIHIDEENFWLGSPASWNLIAVTQYILGIRPWYEGLIIEPVIPENWEGFRVDRMFRGVMYHIKAVRKGKGIGVHLFINGKELPSSLVPLPEQKTKELDITVINE